MQMENGQILFSDFVEAASRYFFSHIYVIWNGTNFYEFVASNDEKQHQQVHRTARRALYPRRFLLRVSGCQETFPSLMLIVEVTKFMDWMANLSLEHHETCDRARKTAWPVAGPCR
ncbi:hypothetical protein ACFS4T_17405 [Pseudomonas lini]